MSDGVSITLAVDLTALQRLRDPQVVVADAREFAENVGVVARSGPPAVSKCIRDAGIEPDFRSGPGGLTTAVLLDNAETFPTDRHVVVGTNDEHREIVSQAEWVYRSVESIAKEHAWRLQYAPPERSVTDFDTEEWP